MLALRNSGGLGGGAAPPHLQNMNEDQNTYIFLHPSDGFALQFVCATCLLYKITVISSLLTLPRGAKLEIERLARSFPRSLNAVIYDIRNLSCSANMRNLSRTANIVIYRFLAFSPSLSKKLQMLLFAVFVTFQEPQPKTSRPRDQGTTGPEDQGTSAPGDQRTRGPEPQLSKPDQNERHL